MSCVYPIDAWYASRLNENGKRPLVFNIRDGFSDRPIQVPCNKCSGCTLDKAKIWGIRMHHEASLHEKNSFLTLTYADPPETINKRDLQLFFKRLRKLSPLRYFACGEYGTQTHRPHYHAIIFGEDYRGGAWQINDELWSHEWVEKAWGKGHVSIGDVTIASCMYVAGYVNKKCNDPDTFNLMSRRPGIGHDWLKKYGSDIENLGQVVINGQKYQVPKKYVEWGDFTQLKKQRAAYYANQSPDDKIQARKDLRSKEINYKARVNTQLGKI